MHKEEADSDLIGFENENPVMKKLKLEMTETGKQIILRRNAMSGKIIILNKNNVKIPVRVCESIPESVRKVVLGDLPFKMDQGHDEKHVEVVKTDNKPYLNVNLAGTSRHSVNLDKAISPVVNVSVIVEPQPKEVAESTRMDSVAERGRLDRRRKKRILTHRQTIKQEVMKCLKQSMKGSQFNKTVKTRTISCQTDQPKIVGTDAVCQTESVGLESNSSDTYSSDILNLIEGSDRDIPFIDVPQYIGKFELGISPLRQTMFGFPEMLPIFGNEVDLQKQKFYECLRNCHVTDPAGHVPLHIGVLNNDEVEVVNQCLMLNTRKIPIDIPNNQGMTPLHLAVLNECDTAIIQTLLSNGANPLTRDGDGNTSLHNAVLCNSNKEILVMLLRNTREVSDMIEVFNYEGFTPLMLCVIENKYDMAWECIKVGADPNTKDQKSGRTSLFHAVETNNIELVKLFMQNGGNTKIKNFFGTSTHEATFELENINPDIKALIIGKDVAPNRGRPTIGKKKRSHEAVVDAKASIKNKLKTVRILKIIEKEATK